MTVVKATSNESKGPVQMSIIQRRRAVQSAFEQAYQLAEKAGGGSSLAEFEQELGGVLAELGKGLCELFLERAAARPRASRYVHGGQLFAMTGETMRQPIGTRFGWVNFRQPVARPVGNRRGARDSPCERELGLCGGFSPSVVLGLSRLCGHLPYGLARETFEQFCGWKPSQRAVLRMIDAVGVEARSFLDEAAPPEDDGQVLVIQVDAKGAPTISSQELDRRTRPQRQKDGNRRHHRRRRRREFPREPRKPGTRRGRTGDRRPSPSKSPRPVVPRLARR